ncbi:LysR family transcriptional regulator [Tistrella mobilis]|uniref:Transcriptional regulator n=1 Tax=Tistrella mobilis TaxID=171437 RepID=A0A161Q6R1_9PROT|nr:LysR family transcriptional regulator [Tistrella mobilis]KYO55528.1 transcriptional regulator [Tistrella mobilis]
MELRHIRYFLAVAEERNFTRAAARLGIGQPPLSLQIRDLEAEVGTALFHRVPHGAELTEAGAAFLAAVAAIPGQAAGAVKLAQRAARGETGRLSLGFTGTAALNPLIPEAIRAFRRAYPEVVLTLTEANSVALVEGLLEGRLQVAILRPAATDPAELAVHNLADEPLVAALPATHAAAALPGPIDLAQLAADPLILTPRAIGTSLHDVAVGAFRAAGFEPVLGQPAPQIASILSLVSAELGVSLVPVSMCQLGMRGVVYRRLRDPEPTVGLAVAYPRHRPPQPVLNFDRVIRQAARAAP